MKMARINPIKLCKSVKYVWKTSKPTFLTIPDKFEGVSSGKGAQNSSKYSEVGQTNGISKNW